MSKINATENPKQDILKAVDAIGSFKSVINEGGKVLVKPNFNSPDTSPASTEPQFLKAIVELLFAHGAGKVVVGESSWQMLRTRKALTQTGTLVVLDGTGAEIAFFDEGSFVKVEVGGEYLRQVNLTNQIHFFFELICFTLNFTISFTRSNGIGLSNGNCIVPFDCSKGANSFLKASIADGPWG